MPQNLMFMVGDFFDWPGNCTGIFETWWQAATKATAVLVVDQCVATAQSRQE